MPPIPQSLEEVRGLRLVLMLATAAALHLIFPAAVAAQESSRLSEGELAQVARLNEEGAQLYEAREFRKAVERFLLAYSIDRDPNLLFNIARCYERLGDDAAALEKYEEFLQTPGTDAEGRARAQASIAALHELQSTPAEPAPAANQPTNASTESTRTDDGASAGNFGAWPWVSLGAGAAIAGTGGVLFALGEAQHASVEDVEGYGEPGHPIALTEAEARSKVELGDTLKTWGVATLATGGALLVTSAVLFWLDADAAVENDVAVSISVDDSVAAIGATGRF
jgi:hypothetical protein